MDERPYCPLPVDSSSAQVSLAHGEGGRLMRRLIAEEISSRFTHPAALALGDCAALPAPPGRMALTTDCYVVSPLFFPGGDIGTLAVFGTANDLAVGGAVPRWLALGMIIEEGLPRETLRRVLDSVAAAARAAGVEVVTGDTKVVPRGAADGLMLCTSGVGELVDPIPPGPGALAPGDAILVSAPLARHGIAVLAAREALALEPPPKSDAAPLYPAVAALREAGIAVRALRDATRGGVAAVLHEWAAASGRSLAIDEAQLPLDGPTRGACELLGLDPLHVACEGTMVAAVPAPQAQEALAALLRVPGCEAAAAIGRVVERLPSPVTVRRALGRELPLDEPAGAPLPRIC